MSIPVGIQLYTVRDVLDQDFKGVVTALAEMGYKGVEFAGQFGGLAPEELAAFLQSVGLQAIGLHTSLDDIGNPDSALYTYTKALGARFVTVSLAWQVANDWQNAIARSSEVAKVAQAQGCVFTYHNHAQEFERIDGEYALDLFYQQTDPALVQAELDTFWIATGGADVVPYLQKHANRLPEIHAKDMNPETRAFAEVGNGMLDWPAIFQVAEAAGTQWVIVEQDVCPGPSLDSARASITNLKKMGLA